MDDARSHSRSPMGYRLGCGHRSVMAALTVALFALGCSEAVDYDRPWDADETRLIQSLSPLPKPLPSEGNRFADDPNAAALGHRLFFDARMSSNGKVACSTCHAPSKYFADGRPLAQGVGTTGRHAPTIMGSQWSPFQYWDGRKDSLWAQSMGPIESDVEHNFTRAGVAHHIYQHYRAPYEAVFGPMPPMNQGKRFPKQARPHQYADSHPEHTTWMRMAPADRIAVNRVFANVGKAIEAYERKLLPQPAPFDAYVAALKAGDAKGGGHISPAAQRGLRAFIGRAQCVNCHNGPLLTDRGFHNIGLPLAKGASGIDMGRTNGADEVKKDLFSCGGAFSDQKTCLELRFLDPRFEDFLGAFKTPSLRNVTETGPYMHDGQFATLEDVLGFYKELPGKPGIGHRDLVLKQIDPTVPTNELIAFLKTLTGPLPPKRWLTAPAGE